MIPDLMSRAKVKMEFDFSMDGGRNMTNQCFSRPVFISKRISLVDHKAYVP